MRSALGAPRAAAVELGWGSLRAQGTQLGVEPVPYRVDYELDVGEHWITRRLQVRATGEDWTRELDLRHDGAGAWTAEAAEEGVGPLPAPGVDVATVNGALDCDLGLCPLTNVMPCVATSCIFVAARWPSSWTLSVPDLGLHPSRQRYEHVGRRDDRWVVSYVGEHRGFVANSSLTRTGWCSCIPSSPGASLDGGHALRPANRWPSRTAHLDTAPRDQERQRARPTPSHGGCCISRLVSSDSVKDHVGMSQSRRGGH